MQKRGRIAFDVVPNKHCRLLISGGFWSKEETFIDFIIK